MQLLATELFKVKNGLLPLFMKEIFLESAQHYYGLKVVSATLLLICFVCQKESTSKTRENVFYFTSKALFILEIIKF